MQRRLNGASTATHGTLNHPPRSDGEAPPQTVSIASINLACSRMVVARQAVGVGLSNPTPLTPEPSYSRHSDAETLNPEQKPLLLLRRRPTATAATALNSGIFLELYWVSPFFRDLP